MMTTRQARAECRHVCGLREVRSMMVFLEEKVDNKCKNTQKDPLKSKNIITIIIIIVSLRITHCSIFELHTAQNFGYRRLRYDRRAILTSKAVLRLYGSPDGGEEEEKKEEMSMWRFYRRRLFRRELRRRR